MNDVVKMRRRKAEGGSENRPSFLPPSTFALPPLIVAVGLTWVFWEPLWRGGSLIGGDLFPYFFPQKVFLAEQLRAGAIPLWNPFTGDGYPTIAESQTGVCYPPDLAAYRFLSVTTAYNAVQLLHYVFGFLGTWLLTRKLGATNFGALFAGVSFIYGWFPPRICLEWAIVSGAYLPWALWCAESYLQQPRRRYLIGLCVVLALQLLAGHFHLAFITQLLLAIYAPLRWRLFPPSPLEGEGPGVRGMPSTPRRNEPESLARDNKPLSLNSAAAVSSSSGLRPLSPSRGDGKTWLPIWLAILVAFLLAAVQVLPTWELKQRSQRAIVSEEHQPGYGHMPPQYWSQAALPWKWYPHDLDAELVKLPNYSGGAGTNQVEAHLYFGLLPLLFAIGGTLVFLRSKTETDRVLRWWMLLGLLFLLYTPGWLLPVARHLPGFNFFRGPGRYGIVTSLAVAVTAGVMFGRLVRRIPRPGDVIVGVLGLALTTAELWWVAQLVGYAQFLPIQVVERRGDSPLRQVLSQEPQPPRLFAPMANVANLLDVSSTPVYLGIGPAEYFDPQYVIPVGPQGGLDPSGNAEQIRWLEENGVTHILSLTPLTSKAWPLERIWSGQDPVLSVAFNQSRKDAFHLYRLKTATGRVVWEGACDGKAGITDYAPQRVAIDCESPSGGTLILRDLSYPGWTVTVDGDPATVERSGMFRAVTLPPGEHRVVWSYQPASVYWGAIISCVALGILLSASVVFFRSPRPRGGEG